MCVCGGGGGGGDTCLVEVNGPSGKPKYVSIGEWVWSPWEHCRVILVNDKVGPGGGALMARGGIFKKQADNMI